MKIENILHLIGALERLLSRAEALQQKQQDTSNCCIDQKDAWLYVILTARIL